MYSEFKAPKKILEAIKRYDSSLDLKYHIQNGCWHLIRYPHSRDKKPTLVWQLDKNSLGLRKELGSWIIDALKMGDTRHTARNRLRDIENQNNLIDKYNDKKMESYCRDYANSIRKPMIKLYQEGNTNYRGVY